MRVELILENWEEVKGNVKKMGSDLKDAQDMLVMYDYFEKAENWIKEKVQYIFSFLVLNIVHEISLNKNSDFFLKSTSVINCLLRKYFVYFICLALNFINHKLKFTWKNNSSIYPFKRLNLRKRCAIYAGIIKHKT